MKIISASLLLSSCITILSLEKISTNPTDSNPCQNNTSETAGPNITCVNITLEDIPQKLDQNLIELTFFHSTIETVATYSFERYRYLKTLRIIITVIKEVKNNEFLKPLTNLEFLHIEDNTPQIFSWYWPLSLKNLTITNMDLFSIGIHISQPLPELKHVDFRNNQLYTFPNLSASDPLETVNLDDNPDIIISVEAIYPYCYLKYLAAKSLTNESNTFVREWEPCKCRHFKKFLVEEKIQNNFINGICKTKTEVILCPYDFDKNLVEIRKMCLNQKNANSKSAWGSNSKFVIPWYMYLVGTVFTMLVFIGTLLPVVLHVLKVKKIDIADIDLDAEFSAVEETKSEKNEEVFS